MYRIKQLFGGSLMLRDQDGQVAEAMAMVRALNNKMKAGRLEACVLPENPTRYRDVSPKNDLSNKAQSPYKHVPKQLKLIYTVFNHSRFFFHSRNENVCKK